MPRVRLPAGVGISFSLRHHVQTGSRAHPTSYPMGTEVPSPGIKQSGHEADHSPPSRAMVQNTWSCNSTPQYVFLEWYSLVRLVYQFYGQVDGNFVDVGVWIFGQEALVQIHKLPFLKVNVFLSSLTECDRSLYTTVLLHQRYHACQWK
jgi:hypothetical protein